jgi:hypothetical protein
MKKKFSDGRITFIFHKKEAILEVFSILEDKDFSLSCKDGIITMKSGDIIKCREKDGSRSKIQNILKFLERAGFKEIKSNNQRLKELVIKILNQTGDDPCWMDWNGLYKELAYLCGLKDWEPKILPKEIMLKNCERFIDCMLKGTEYKKEEYIVDVKLLRLIYLHLTLPFPDEEKEEKKEIIAKLKEILKNDEILHIER